MNSSSPATSHSHDEILPAHLIKKIEQVETKHGQHVEDIRRLEKSVDSVHQRITVTSEKFELRINTAEHDRRKGNQRLLDKIEDILKNSSADTTKESDALHEKLEKISTDIANLSSDYHAKHNILKSAIWVTVIVISISQILLVTYVREYSSQILKLQSYDQMNESRESDNRKQTLLIQTQVAQLTELLVKQQMRK